MIDDWRLTGGRRILRPSGREKEQKGGLEMKDER